MLANEWIHIKYSSLCYVIKLNWISIKSVVSHQNGNECNMLAAGYYTKFILLVDEVSRSSYMDGWLESRECKSDQKIFQHLNLNWIQKRLWLQLHDTAHICCYHSSAVLIIIWISRHFNNQAFKQYFELKTVKFQYNLPHSLW